MTNNGKRRSTYGAAVTTRNDAVAASDEDRKGNVTRGEAGEGGAASGAGGAGSGTGATVESTLQELLLDALNLLNKRLQPSPQDQPQAQQQQQQQQAVCAARWSVCSLNVDR